ncbi:integrin alpha-D [Kryptolebias marmoratus]|uniref:integrin alpha-D n=1 Tax=Kryptolebias marmoratus TaxID=37003 RepID=UPI0007F8ABE5|nr:integrin alpha-D [Kryptolebias marmoratus]
MDEPRRFPTLSCVLAAAAIISISSAFNINVRNSDVVSGEQKDFFGYKVLQFSSSRNKGIIVTAPLNGSGAIFRRDQNRTEKWFRPDDRSPSNSSSVKHLGLSVAAHPTGSRFTVCSPSLFHECNGNSYLNSLCYNLTDELQQISSFKPVFQECIKETVNLVFLFDGSQSMTTGEFNKNKDFIKDMMETLKNTSIKFAAVQFSLVTRTVFDFNDYDAGRALEKLSKEKHMKSLTNTYQALRFVWSEILENPASGASPDATKALVVITDGDPSDSDTNNIVKQYDGKDIIRIVIGVKDVDINHFKPIASEPKDTNVFKIDNYNGLEGVLKNFQNKIFKIEGSKVTRAEEMTNEMSQAGFSSVFHKETLVLGSVGSNSWRGSLHEHQEQNETQISDPEMEMDSYMGYSLSVGERKGVPLYFAGAPRFNHTGQVVLFTQNNKNWTTAQRINADQIGSYFGAELCSVDIDSDGNTDFLLVGAPMFYQPQEKREGRIYIYRLSDEIQLMSVYHVTAPSKGRFGSTISSLSDLNGDELRDVAVGAPLEDDNRGAVYIYLGDRDKGIRSPFSQRITGKKLGTGIRFFGQAIDGHLDLGDDGLPDIVVGSQGAAVVLRSKPIFNVTAHLSFYPGEISTEDIDCLAGKDKSLPMGTITACFEKEEATKSKGEAARSGLNISYTLNVDPMRQTNRGFFPQNEKKDRSITHFSELLETKTCFNHSINMPKCVRDTLSPVDIRLNFSQVDSETVGVVLNVDSGRQAVVEAPFEKHCRTNDICIAQLTVDFNFTSETLLVTENNYFNVSIKLDNDGDDSYNTTLTMHYPPGLSFSRMNLTQSSRSTLHSCFDLDGVFDKTVCGISLPVYRSKASATFKTAFHVSKYFEWNDTLSMTVTGTSDNSNSSSSFSVTKSIPVQYQIRMALTVNENTVSYLNFTPEDTHPKNMDIIYKIDNIGFKEFPVDVSLFFPTKLEHNFEVIDYQVFVQQNKTQCSNSSDLEGPEFCSPENKCVVVKCDSFILKNNSGVEFRLKGNVQFKDFKQHAANVAFLKRYTGVDKEVKFRSFIKVDYDRKTYVLASHKQEKKGSKQEQLQKSDLWKEDSPTMKWAEVRVEFINPPDQLQIILTGAGLGLLLLIIITIIMIKLGCFRRKRPDYYQEQEEQVSIQDNKFAEMTPGPSNETTISETFEKPDEIQEKKKLLDASEANGSPVQADKEKDPDQLENINVS